MPKQSIPLLLLSLLPLLSANVQAGLFHPLFSAAPTSSISLPFHLVVFTVFFLSSSFSARLTWRTSWLILGLSLIANEGVVKTLGAWLMRRGNRKGLWIGRLAGGEGLGELMTWISVVGGVQKNTPGWTKVVLGSVTALVLLSGQPVLQLPYWVPACYTLQCHGLLLVLVALYLPEVPPSQAKKKKSPSSLPPASSTRILRLPRAQILFLALVSAFLTSLTSSHCPLSPLVRPHLLPHSLNTTILASVPSITGLITVGEEKIGGHWCRYLRCDHSVLGGLWVGPSREEVIRGMERQGASLWDKVDESEVVRRAETIYSTFVLQEIVRLAGDPLKQHRGGEKALVIGLGAGLSARALHAHGINTTIVEIDPAVYELARKYFGVEEPRGGAVLEDARVFLKREPDVKYEYVIHDVFTGGSVPAALFTLECWNEIKAVLAPGGVVAINFAGNVQSRVSRVVLSTLAASFAHCRAFQDGPTQGDFRNVVILCSAHTELRFRAPVARDYLMYPSPGVRKRVLESFQDHEWDIREIGKKDAMRDGEEAALAGALLSGALEHWEIMRAVLPESAWVSY